MQKYTANLNSNDTNIKIVAMRVWEQCEPKYRVLMVHAAKRDDLPESYFEDYPYCYLLASDTLVLVYMDDKRHEYELVHIQPNQVYKKDEFEEYLIHIKCASERLTDIIKKNTGIHNKGWKGIFKLEC